jgi:uncharacterized protein DUF4337
MRLPPTKVDETEPEPGSAPRKPFWTTVLNSTPVVLTVVATVLAGLSSSEMTQAQYHRALAAQNQSKASDQWNFFQFKRSRGMTAQLTIDLLHALSHRGRIKSAAWKQTSEQLVHDLREVEKEANSLLARLSQGKVEPAGDRLRQAVTEFVPVALALAREAEVLDGRLNQELAGSDVQRAFSFLETKDVPQVTIHGVDDPGLAEAQKAIEARQAEKDTAPLIAKIPQEKLQQAIELLEGNVQAVEDANKPISDTLSKLDTLLQQQLDVANDFYQAVQLVNRSWASVTAGDSRSPGDIRLALDGMVQSTDQARKAVQDWSNEFKVAQFGYTVRRYEVEARHNQKAAALYEVQIRRSSALSEKHRDRSRHFFYGMLVAQAGVTIASFSLALKHKSFFWGIASLAGVGAVVFSGWVYLYR